MRHLGKDDSKSNNSPNPNHEGEISNWSTQTDASAFNTQVQNSDNNCLFYSTWRNYIIAYNALSNREEVLLLQVFNKDLAYHLRNIAVWYQGSV